MGAMEDQQRKNIENSLRTGSITQSEADAARAKLDAIDNARSGMVVPAEAIDGRPNRGGGGGGGWSQTDAYPTQSEISSMEQYDPNYYINQLKEAQRASRIAALDKARNNALSALDTEKAGIAPVYYDKRNQAAAASDVGAMNFAQYMAARGIKGAAGAMPEVYRQAGLQGQIGALDRQEAAALAGIERQRTNINTGYESDVAAANADVEAQAMQSIIDQYNADRNYRLQEAGLTGILGGTRTLAGQQFDWSRSSSNPEYQAQILANRARELDNAAQEIQNSYLPDTLKLQAERLAQQVKAGSLDYDTALAQLNQIKAQTANYQRLASGGGGSGGSGGLTANQQANLTQAAYSKAVTAARADKRLSETPDGQNTFSLAQLIDAYYKLFSGQQGTGGTYTDDQLLSLL